MRVAIVKAGLAVLEIAVDLVTPIAFIRISKEKLCSRR